jgi:hypothetical protein
MTNKRSPNKQCSSCKEKKYLKDFSKNKNRPDGHHTQCKVCRSKYKPSEESRLKNNERLRRWNRFKTSGFTQEDYDNKLKEQDYKCAICKTSDSGSMAFHADHDHATGQKRGVLCHKCNTGLGLLKDDINVLCSAIEYLNHYTR